MNVWGKGSSFNGKYCVSHRASHLFFSLCISLEPPYMIVTNQFVMPVKSLPNLPNWEDINKTNSPYTWVCTHATETSTQRFWRTAQWFHPVPAFSDHYWKLIWNGCSLSDLTTNHSQLCCHIRVLMETDRRNAWIHRFRFLTVSHTLCAHNNAKHSTGTRVWPSGRRLYQQGSPLARVVRPRPDGMSYGPRPTSDTPFTDHSGEPPARLATSSSATL